MTDPQKDTPALPPKTPEKRFPKAAVDFIDTLLDVQRSRFEKELASLDPEISWQKKPSSVDLLAESDAFVGSGWGSLDFAKDGTGRRWMARIGTILLSADLSAGGQLSLAGGGYLKRRFLSDLTVWVDDVPIDGTIRRVGIKNWTFEGKIPPLQDRPYHIVRLQTTGIRRSDLGPDTHASIALAGIRFNG
ncbi:MAG: hypothetical protein HWE25_03240 [Alphaproteobacteria bacterium]|nr:hypothetical protein [Alphaproteobacteria bacterium]